MFKNKTNLLISIKYIIVSGASKGFNYILLFYFAIGIYSEQYITILLLLSLEQILSLLLPLNHSSLIYSKTILDYKLVTNKMTTNSIVMVLLFVIIYFLLKEQVWEYFEVKNTIIFLSLFVSMLINSYLVYLTNYYKIIEQHGKALLVQALLLTSFLTIVLLILILKDVVVAFFLGKAIGLIIVIMLLKPLKLFGFSFSFSLLSKEELKKVFNLFSVSALGWASGLGFLNLAKIYSTPAELVEIGYILNIYNIFLLISVGVNSIYAPLIKRNLIDLNKVQAFRIKMKTLILYLFIAFVTVLLYYVVSNINLNFNNEVEAIISVFPYAILLFVLNGFIWVAQPFYLINDKFKNYNLINILSYILWGLILICCLYFGYRNFILFLVMIHFIKSALTFFYAQMDFMEFEK